MSKFQNHLYKLENDPFFRWRTFVDVSKNFKECLRAALSDHRKIYDFLWRVLAEEGTYICGNFRNIYDYGWDYDNTTQAIKAEFKMYAFSKELKSLKVEDFL